MSLQEDALLNQGLDFHRGFGFGASVLGFRV